MSSGRHFHMAGIHGARLFHKYLYCRLYTTTFPDRCFRMASNARNVIASEKKYFIKRSGLTLANRKQRNVPDDRNRVT